jgi:hypothetical protein
LKRIRFSLRGLFVVFGIVALGLPIAFIGLFGVLRQLNQFNSDVAIVRNAQLNVAALLRCQLDEQLSLRAYEFGRLKAYLLPYQNALVEFDQQERDLRKRLIFTSEVSANRYLDDAILTNKRWKKLIAAPILAGGQPLGNIKLGTTLVGRFRLDVTTINDLILVEYRSQLERRARTIATASIIGFSAIALIGIQALVFAFLLFRLRDALDREHGVVEALQAAFAGNVARAPALEVATTYLSATRGAKIGGDVYDVYPVDDDISLILIADVSGKGVAAAVDTTFVKYSLRAFASEHRDVSVIVRKFNALYSNAQKAPEAFVVLFCGYYDRRTATLTYVNAGHEAAYVCRKDGVEQLAPTDSIIGLVPDVEFHPASAMIDSTGILFLATDGLTEARNSAGRFLTSAGVMQWLREAETCSPQALVTDISERLRRYAGANINDDLAILAVRPRTGETSEHRSE